MNDQLTNIKLAKEIEKHGLLCNHNVPGYSRKDLTEKAWHEVAAKVNMTGKMKTPQTESGRNKKAYDLADSMQFSFSIIKSSVAPFTGNLPKKPHDKTTDETIENTDIYDGLKNSSYLEQSSELQPPPQSQTLFLSPSASPASPALSQLINHPKKQFSSSRNNKCPKSKNTSAAKAHTCVTIHVKAKKTRSKANLVTNYYNSENKKALKMFLLSLMPEVEHFNNYQIKLFKRKIFSVIDDISSQSSSKSSLPSTTPLPSAHTSQGTTSGVSEDTTKHPIYIPL